ncbi:MAG TPA: metallophosphoesterase [Chthoniobacteraceae bacterium]|nr:metallophosphoesterase [Chthoniobacteraceae bacterium]
MSADSKTLRIAATGDLHYNRTSKGRLQALFAEASKSADVLLLCGDLTDYGHAEEAHVLAEDIQAHATVPVMAVLGNHDFETGHVEEISRIFESAGVIMLEGECKEIGGVGFAGVCGFGGGFGRFMLNAWGEPLIKDFAQEGVNQAMKLERALARLQTPKRVVITHYAPVRDTVVGEDPEVFAFLGSSRLEGPLNRFNVAAAFHGHAHNGAAEGQSSNGVPIYNVSLPVLKRAQPEQPWFRLFEVQP